MWVEGWNAHNMRKSLINFLLLFNLTLSVIFLSDFLKLSSFCIISELHCSTGSAAWCPEDLWSGSGVGCLLLRLGTVLSPLPSSPPPASTNRGQAPGGRVEVAQRAGSGIRRASGESAPLSSVKTLSMRIIIYLLMIDKFYYLSKCYSSNRLYLKYPLLLYPLLPK